LSISFEAKERPDHLLLVCAGSFTYDSMIRLYEQAFTLAAAAGLGAVLIDARPLAGPPPTIAERINGAMAVARLQSAQNPKIRLAVVGHEPIIHPERIGEVVATARGAVARVFTDETIALEWLLPRQKSP